jgi:methylenetetrahydrofolate reductase (NADPH)
MDVDLRRPWAPLEALDAAGVDEVLVITGDPPVDMRHPVTGAHVLDVIRMIKRERPGWRVYAALDPYRAGFAQERDYVQRKLDAGSTAFFTQPFFDVRLMAVWRDLMGDVPIYWGITSVTSDRSQRYWLTRNRAVFPAGFEPTLAWHRRFAGRGPGLRRGARHPPVLHADPGGDPGVARGAVAVRRPDRPRSGSGSGRGWGR